MVLVFVVLCEKCENSATLIQSQTEKTIFSIKYSLVSNLI